MLLEHAQPVLGVSHAPQAFTDLCLPLACPGELAILRVGAAMLLSGERRANGAAAARRRPR
eukprot:3784312-Lingulodinium_polyedra.AAC.1